MKRIAFTAVGCALALLVISQRGCAAQSAAKKAPDQGPRVVKPSGKVVETMEAGGYTYICLEDNGRKIWAATPTMKIEIGEELQLVPGAEMSNFRLAICRHKTQTQLPTGTMRGSVHPLPPDSFRGNLSNGNYHSPIRSLLLSPARPLPTIKKPRIMGCGAKGYGSKAS